jgi:hypothetical protein
MLRNPGKWCGVTQRVLLAASIALATLGRSASGQLSHGSIAVLQSADDYLVIAADSKRLSAKGVSLHSCKVDALDNQLVFAHTGYSYSGVRGKWDAISVAREHYRQLSKTARHELIPTLAETFGSDIAAKLEPDVRGHPEEGWPQTLGTAIFAGFDENHQRIVVEVNIHQVRAATDVAVGYTTRRLPSSDAVFAEVIGETSIAQEFAEGRTLRSQSWRNGLDFQVKGLGVKERLVAGAEKIVELTATYQPSVVGGAIDTVLLSRTTGVEWVHRKPECANLSSIPSIAAPKTNSQNRAGR